MCAFSRIPISPFFHFMKCFFSLVYIYIYNWRAGASQPRRSTGTLYISIRPAGRRGHIPYILLNQRSRQITRRKRMRTSELFSVGSLPFAKNALHSPTSWGERERAPTWWSQRDFCTIYIYIYIYVRTSSCTVTRATRKHEAGLITSIEIASATKERLSSDAALLRA